MSLTLGPATGPDIIGQIEAVDITLGGEASPELQEQVALNKKLARQAVQSGAIGNYEDESVQFIVTIDGHANPGHEPEGEAKDKVSLVVEQA